MQGKATEFYNGWTLTYLVVRVWR